jgi:hypothetical protein
MALSSGSRPMRRSSDARSFSVDVLHRDEVAFADLPDVVHAANVRMRDAQ